MAVLMLRGAKKIGSLGDLDLRVAQRQDTVRVTPFERIERSSHDLDVLLRHRLLLEAEVRGGSVAVPIADEPSDLAITDVEHMRCLRPHLSEVQPARFATPDEVVEHEQALKALEIRE